MRMTKVSSRFWLAAVVVGALLLAQESAHAKGSFENPKGDPPFGVAIQSDAQGAKLIGVLVTEAYDLRDVYDPITGITYKYGKLRAALRLRHGSAFAMFYGEIAGEVDINNMDEIQPALIATFKEKVLAHFFGSTGQSMKLKSMTEYGQLDLCTDDPAYTPLNNCQPGSPYTGNSVTVSDVVFAVK